MELATRISGGVALVLAPLMFGIADHLRMQAEGDAAVTGSFAEWGPAEAAAQAERIAAAPGALTLAGFATYAALLVTILALVAAWRLAVRRSPLWSWAGAVLAVLGVIGMISLAVDEAVRAVAVAELGPSAMVDLTFAREADPLSMVLSLPHIFAFLCVVPQAIALRRARVIPVWSLIALLTATAVILVLGSSFWTTSIWAMLLIVGFAPAAARLLRGRTDSAAATASPATAVA
jgi:hypothetical protein